MSVNPVELFWLSVNSLTFAVTLWALIDARKDLAAVRALNGHIRGIIARGNVRREWVRLGVQALLLGIAVPGLFSDRETAITPVLAMFLCVPVLLLANTLLDHRDRGRVADRLAKDIETARTAQIGRIETLAQDTKDIAEETNDRVIDLQERS